MVVLIIEYCFSGHFSVTTTSYMTRLVYCLSDELKLYKIM